MRALHAAATLATLLIFALAFAHVAELPGKLRLDGAQWLMVQQHLYIAFGPIGAIVELLAVLLIWVLAWRTGWRQPGARRVIAAAVCVTVGLVAWALIVAPMNARISAMQPDAPAATWTAVRDRWELGHAVHAALFGAALALLLCSPPRGPVLRP
ncbi:MAG: DUF1772 domain-containing protein, partial [Alphaproteobacteria bacterium]|nr:DUF1772 domain-containing protein [Alphaproteobacteria bacterium]